MASQSTHECAEGWVWPDELDALTAAPDHHFLLFENERVRVLRTCIKPGQVTPLHTHRWPAVITALTSGNFLRRDQQGKIVLDSRTPSGRVIPNTPTWLPCIPPHTVENIGEYEYVAIQIEIKDGGADSRSTEGGIR